MTSSRPSRTFRGLPAAAALLLFVVVAAQAQVSQPPAQEGAEAGARAESRGPYARHPEAVKAIGRLKSPYCKGFMLEVCSSSAGAALRDSIEALADEGWKAERIVDWVLANHGEEYLALPPRQGKALVAWVVPPLAILLGFGLVITALRQMRRARPAPPEPRDLTSEDEERLKAALRELEAEEDVPFI